MNPKKEQQHTDESLFVTRTRLPEPEQYVGHLKHIFDSHQLSNHGQYAMRLEKVLGERWELPHILLCTNGTLALQLAIRAAGLAGKKVITTPFTYVATVSSLLWENCEPVFVDIDENTLCLDPVKVAQRLDDDIRGLLPVHVYGMACEVEALGSLAGDAGVSLIYDAAQAIDSTYQGKQLAAFGDFAALSFHATKLFYTGEGGAVVCHSKQEAEKIFLLRAFGHINDEHFCLGTNAKMSELHAAMGLCSLDLLTDRVADRGRVSCLYDERLPWNTLRRPERLAGLQYNNAYYPVIFPDEKTLIKVVDALHRENIYPRRYFYPSLTTLPYINQEGLCPVAEDIAPRVLSLPLQDHFTEQEADRVSAAIIRSL